MDAHKFTLILQELYYSKSRIVHELFGDCKPKYQQEWLDRDIYHFWNHLDSGNQDKVIKMAIGDSVD